MQQGKVSAGFLGTIKIKAPAGKMKAVQIPILTARIGQIIITGGEEIKDIRYRKKAGLAAGFLLPFIVSGKVFLYDECNEIIC